MSSLKLPEHPGLSPGAAERMSRDECSGNLTLGACHLVSALQTSSTGTEPSKVPGKRLL